MSRWRWGQWIEGTLVLLVILCLFGAIVYIAYQIARMVIWIVTF